ncbi:hypothetical protein FA13DRAFT_1797507 [Coprinellus micaceus]|uniref:Uncharacterized protein n=1 Tax=Coprinellus micaceus TaxID=71717 RepID=A0A4Y7SR89_COPMI|nr:hypothetical protein FA13DRAFT_1797507 [Coprinellus micaceus]
MSSVHPPVSVQLQALYGLPELKALTLGRTCEEGQQAIDFFSSRGKASTRVYVQSSEEWAVGVRMMFSTLMQFEVGITHHLFSHLTLRFPSEITTPQFHREMTLRVLNLKPNTDYIPVKDVDAAVSSASRHDPELLKHDFAWWTNTNSLDASIRSYVPSLQRLLQGWTANQKHFPIREPSPTLTLNSTIGNINLLTGKEILSYMDTLDDLKESLDTQMNTTTAAMTHVWVELQRFQAISQSLEEDGQGLHPPLLDLEAPPEAVFSIPPL